MIFENILSEKNENVLDDLITRYHEKQAIDKDWAKQLSVESAKAAAANKKLPQDIDTILERWYKSLESDNPDYSVYSEDAYIAELWVCWKIYSRTHLLNIQKPNSLFTDSIANGHKNDSTIIDLGCGFAYTTTAIKQIFPQANVIGTNLEDTLQMKVAQDMAKDYGFQMTSGPDAITTKADLIFASEYFEHFEAPIEHLDMVIESLNPRAMLIANAFGPIAIGHFKNYKVKLNDVFGTEIIDAKSTSKIFNDRMKQHGYKKVKTKLWNNRPAYWVKD